MRHPTRLEAFTGSPNDSVFMRWFIRATWVAWLGIIVLLAVIRAYK